MDELSSPSALKKDVGFFEEEEKELSKVTKNADIEWYSTSELKGESLSFRSNKYVHTRRVSVTIGNMNISISDLKVRRETRIILAGPEMEGETAASTGAVLLT